MRASYRLHVTTYRCQCCAPKHAVKDADLRYALKRLVQEWERAMPATADELTALIDRVERFRAVLPTWMHVEYDVTLKGRPVRVKAVA